MNVRLRRFARTQSDLVAFWQLREAGWTPDSIRHQAARGAWRPIHRGVYALTQAPLTRHQQWIAATLTAPRTVLSHASAGDCYDVRRFRGSYETVTRPGTGGPKRVGSVLISRSTTLPGNVTRDRGVLITTPERTVIDLAPHSDREQCGRMVREAIRLELTNTKRLTAALDAHPNHRGTSVLRELARLYEGLAFERTRADSEALALVLLKQAGIEIPRVNVWIHGEEADLVWWNHKVIIEIDGPQYHQFREEDLRKQAIWETPGFAVHRVSSDAIYDHPASFIALVVGALSAASA
jgi:very-short-patch-repair endonuclease